MANKNNRPINIVIILFFCFLVALVALLLLVGVGRAVGVLIVLRFIMTSTNSS